MPAESVTCFVFVDFENVPEVDLGLVAGKPVHVTLLLGKHQKKVDIALVQQIRRLADQIELVEVGASGHNALDLTLAYYLGRTVERSPGAQFCIVSKDKDFEPMIGHLRGRQIKVERYTSFAALPFLPQAKKAAAPAKKLPEERRSKVMARLKNPAARNRPASRNALLAHIKTALGKESSDAAAAEIVGRLVAEGTLDIGPDGKVVFASAKPA